MRDQVAPFAADDARAVRRDSLPRFSGSRKVPRRSGRREVALSCLLAVALGCGDGASGPSESCLSSVTLRPETGALAGVDRLEVVAVTPEGCAPLDGPLAAFNYFSFADRATYLSYGAEVVQILARRGARIIATGDHDETLEAPRGEPATGGAYVHEEFAVPLYPSAAEFMDMISSPEFQSIVSRQQAGARQEDYVFGFQKCLAGCDSGVTAAASDDAPLLLHVFRYEGADIESAIRSLEGAAGAPEMVYAGRLVGRFQVIVGGANLNTQNLPWGDGAVVFRFDSREAARAWTNGATFRRFRENTAEDVLVLLGSAAIAGG